MRLYFFTFALFLSFPAGVVAQEAPESCQTLAVIQNADCTVRRVTICDGAPPDWRNVAIYSSAGITTVSTFNADGIPVSFDDGPGTPQTRLGLQPDPLQLATMFDTGTDTFDYQLNRSDGSITHVSGKVIATGESVTIDGRVLQAVQMRQIIGAATNEPILRDIDFLYDADLQLLITDGIRDPVKRVYLQHRSPLDFIFPGEAGFEDYTPRFGCEG